MNSSGLQVHDQIEEKMALLREEAPLAFNAVPWCRAAVPGDHLYLLTF